MRTRITVAILLVITTILVVLQRARDDENRKSPPGPAEPGASGIVRLPSGRSLPSPSPLPLLTNSLNQPTIATEVAYSSDVYATYEKYKSVADPTGQVSYFLYKGLDDCTPFAGRSPEQISRLMNARRQPIDNPQRAALIRRSIDRCKGFTVWDHRALILRVEELKKKATAAGYPAAVATTLPTVLSQQGMQQADKIAMSLLSGPVDGDVVQGIYQYLLARNGRDWFAEQGDPSAAFAAWTLLQCNMGADCGDRSRVVLTACVYFGACDQHDVVTVLPVEDPGLDPERLQQAIEIETALGTAIQNRDWVRLGFTYQRKQTDSTSK